MIPQTPKFDIIFAGGGLASGLAAFFLHKRYPSLKLLMLEKDPLPGGHHTWSFHHSDIMPHQFKLISQFISKSWDSYSVQFPRHRRTIPGPYHSIRSERFRQILAEIPSLTVLSNEFISAVEPYSVTTEKGRVYSADCVFDGRGWNDPSTIKASYQKFVGLDLTLQSPHGLTDPLLMDATIPQEDGFRFFYLLPWSSHSLLVEDTRYSDTMDLNPLEYRNEIMAYAKEKGWQVASVDREEIGILPIPLEGRLPTWDNQVPALGTRAGLFHATTGYSLPDAVRFAEMLSSLETFSTERVFDWAWNHANRHWQKENFFRFLNRMLFRASEPQFRYKILQKFYRAPEESIAHFYSGSLKPSDYFHIFSGTPPVPFMKALRCLSERKVVA